MSAARNSTENWSASRVSLEFAHYFYSSANAFEPISSENLKISKKFRFIRDECWLCLLHFSECNCEVIFGAKHQLKRTCENKIGTSAQSAGEQPRSNLSTIQPARNRVKRSLEYIISSWSFMNVENCNNCFNFELLPHSLKIGLDFKASRPVQWTLNCGS